MKVTIFLCILGLSLAAVEVRENKYDVDPNDRFVRYLLQTALNFNSPSEHVVTVEKIVGLGVEGYNYIIDYVSSKDGTAALFECHTHIVRPVGTINIPSIESKSCFALP